jgi:hypothetical protein
MYSDSGFGFLVLRSMLEGAPFNNVISPDPANIANDVATFLSWWSPGQYLVPGFFVWLGTDYGHALSLTVLISTLVGVIGWIQVARTFPVSTFVSFLFISGLVTFRYVTLPFRIYNGGEVLLFAAAPWCLYWLQYAVNKGPAACFVISLLSAALLFFAKLTGLIVFAANVLAISLIAALRQRRVTVSILAMWIASGLAALCFVVLWVARGAVPAGGSKLAITWPSIWFPLSGVAFSGFSGLDLLTWLLLHPSRPIVSDLAITSYILGPFGLFLLIWTWYRLRDTDYRPMAIGLFAIIAFYTLALTVMHVRQAVSFDDRNLRYAGILFFLLLLVALDHWRTTAARIIAVAVVGAFAVYGLTSYAAGARDLLRRRIYEPASGTSQLIVSPLVLEYLRSQMAIYNWQRAIAVLPSPEAAVGLPRFRIIATHLDFTPLETISAKKWNGRAEKIFVIVQNHMIENGKAEALLKSFVDYEFDKWSQRRLDGMLVYSQ